MARGLRFWIKVVEGMFYTCSENKGADQFCGYHEADLRLCFRIYYNPPALLLPTVLVNIIVVVVYFYCRLHIRYPKFILVVKIVVSKRGIRHYIQ